MLYVRMSVYVYYDTSGPFVHIENELLCTVIHYVSTILTGGVISVCLKSDSHILQIGSCITTHLYIMIS